MQINTTTNNPQNFEALYIHKGSRLGKTYKYNNEIITYIKNDLTKLAQDVDLHIRYRNILDKGLDITVGKITKSPFKRFFGLIGPTAGRAIRPGNLHNNSIIDTIINNIEGAKEDYYRGLSRNKS